MLQAFTVGGKPSETRTPARRAREEHACNTHQRREDGPGRPGRIGEEE